MLIHRFKVIELEAVLKKPVPFKIHRFKALEVSLTAEEKARLREFRRKCFE